MKTETSSFRLNKEIFTRFKKEAKKQGLTVNSLINKIMREYIEWSSMAPAIQLIPYPAPIIIELLKNQTEEKIRKLARNQVNEHFEENMLLLKNEVSVDAFLEMIENWCEASGFPYSTREKNGSRNFTVRHNHGVKFSILLDEAVKTQIEILTKQKAEVKQTANSVSFWI